MAELRHAENGCPWDLAQNFASIVPHTLEEAYEVAEAIENGDMDELRSELGDLLFQVIFYSRLAEEQGNFDFEQVVEHIIDKLIRRHPHVFTPSEGERLQILNAEEQTRAWEIHKAKERAASIFGKHSALAGIAIALPALTRSVKLQKRAAHVGFDWPDVQPVLDKVLEELNEVREELDNGANPARLEEELGDLLFACTNLARHIRVEPETALRKAGRKFERRFAHMEVMAQQHNNALADLGLDEWMLYWDRVKSEEHSDKDASSNVKVTPVDPAAL